MDVPDAAFYEAASFIITPLFLIHKLAYRVANQNTRLQPSLVSELISDSRTRAANQTPWVLKYAFSAKKIFHFLQVKILKIQILIQARNLIQSCNKKIQNRPQTDSRH